MIPYYLEKLIHEGRAEAKSFSTAMAENAIIPVPNDTYIIIYEYWYKPLERNLGDISTYQLFYNDLMQFVHFYNTSVYNVYWHEFKPGLEFEGNEASTENPNNDGQAFFKSTIRSTDYRSVYIKAERDLSIYFTLMNSETPSVDSAVLPDINPANDYFGYANYLPPVMTGANGYHGIIAQGYSYQNLNDQITLESGNPLGNIRNLMYTQPNTGGGMPFFDIYGLNIGGFPGSALGKVRSQHFQCNYVQVNTKNPKNLI